MKQNQIKFKNLKEDQIIQIIDLNDYFGNAIPTITKPLTKKEFIKEHLQEIVDENENISVNEAFSMIIEDVDGDSNKVYTTVEEGFTKVIIS